MTLIWECSLAQLLRIACGRCSWRTRRSRVRYTRSSCGTATASSSSSPPSRRSAPTTSSLTTRSPTSSNRLRSSSRSRRRRNNRWLISGTHSAYGVIPSPHYSHRFFALNLRCSAAWVWLLCAYANILLVWRETLVSHSYIYIAHIALMRYTSTCLLHYWRRAPFYARRYKSCLQSLLNFLVDSP